MKNKILQAFLNSHIKIKSQEKLEEYINYCILNNKKEKIKGKTEHHHILPNKLFSEYKNLNCNKWNGVHLLYKDHYIAHSILAEALDNFSMTAAWWAMNNLNSRSGKINSPDTIIGEGKYSKLKEKFSNQISSWYNEEIIVNGISTTNVKVHTEKLNNSMKELVIFEGVEMSRRKMAIIKKHRNTDTFEISRKAAKTMMKEYIDENGNLTTIAKERAKKASITMMKEYIDENGNLTSIRKESDKKRKETDNKKYIDENGLITTKAIERGKAISTTKLNKSKLWNVYDIDDNLIHSSIYTKDLKLISQGLIKTSKDRRLGNNIFSLNNLKKVNKEYLIGYYAIQIK